MTLEDAKQIMESVNNNTYEHPEYVDNDSTGLYATQDDIISEAEEIINEHNIKKALNPYNITNG